jgi:hypothetical protein
MVGGVASKCGPLFLYIGPALVQLKVGLILGAILWAPGLGFIGSFSPSPSPLFRKSLASTQTRCRSFEARHCASLLLCQAQADSVSKEADNLFKS